MSESRSLSMSESRAAMRRRNADGGGLRDNRDVPPEAMRAFLRTYGWTFDGLEPHALPSGAELLMERWSDPKAAAPGGRTTWILDERPYDVAVRIEATESWAADMAAACDVGVGDVVDSLHQQWTSRCHDSPFKWMGVGLHVLEFADGRVRVNMHGTHDESSEAWIPRPVGLPADAEVGSLWEVCLDMAAHYFADVGPRSVSCFVRYVPTLSVEELALPDDRAGAA